MKQWFFGHCTSRYEKQTSEPYRQLIDFLEKHSSLWWDWGNPGGAQWTP